MSVDAPVGSQDLDAEHEAGEAGTAPPPLAVRRRRVVTRAQRRRMWVVGIVIVGAIGFLVYKGLTSAIVFFKTANEAVAQRAQLGNSDFQMEGTVVAGSVHHVNGAVYR